MSPSWGLLGPAIDLDRFAAEGVDPGPPAGDVEQVDAADAGRQGRVDDQVVADRFQAQHRAQEHQRRAGRPGLRAARGGVLDRNSVRVWKDVIQTKPTRNGTAGSMVLPLALAQFIASYAATNMNVAISAIAKDLGTNVAGVQTAITLFTLTMAALMIRACRVVPTRRAAWHVPREPR